MRAEHEIHLRELARQSQQRVGVCKERGKRKRSVPCRVDSVVRTDNDLFPRARRAHDLLHLRRQTVHLAVPGGDGVARKKRVPRDSHGARGLVRDEVPPGKHNVRQERSLLLVADEKPAISVVENRHKRTTGHHLDSVLRHGLVLVYDCAEDDVGIDFAGLAEILSAESHHSLVSIARRKGAEGLVHRLAHELIPARHAWRDGNEGLEPCIAKHRPIYAFAGEHGSVADEKGNLQPLAAGELRAALRLVRGVARAYGGQQPRTAFVARTVEETAADALAHALRRD